MFLDKLDDGVCSFADTAGGLDHVRDKAPAAVAYLSVVFREFFLQVLELPWETTGLTKKKSISFMDRFFSKMRQNHYQKCCHACSVSFGAAGGHWSLVS